MTDSGVGGHHPGLWPVPGDGVLARHGGLVLLSSLDDSQFVDVLLDLLEQHAASGGDGRKFADAVADALEGADGESGQGPSVLAFGDTGSGLAVTVSGGAWADVTTAHGTARIEASHPGMLMRCLLRSPASGVVGGLSPDDNGAASTDRFSRLDAGTVRAGGLGYYPAGAPGAPGPGPGGGKKARPSLAKAPPARKAATPEPAAPEPAAPEPAGAELAEPELAEPESEAPEVAAAEMAVPEEPEPAAPEPAAPQAPPVPDQQAPVKHEPTAAWIPPAEPPPAGTQQWTPEWSGGPVEPDVTIPPDPNQFHEPFEAVLLTGGAVDVPDRQPLSLARDIPPGVSSYVSAGPIIQGVYCKNGHFDDPEALFCAICGISMNQQTLVPRPGERPPLGVLLLDDGSVFQLDSEYVVGREPSLDSAVAQGKARPLRVADDSGIVSRVHARIQLEGWRVLVTDLGSANGTRVMLPGQPGEQPLVPQVPVVLATGSQVDLGGRMFRYESHRGR